MKKLIFIIIPALLIALLIYLLIAYYSNRQAQKGALQVTSNPVSKVYLDDQLLGKTPLSKTEANDMISSGEYTIKLVPEDTSYSQYQEKITIATGILTVVDRKFHKDSQSEGSTISLHELSDKNQTELEVVSIPSESAVELDSNPIGTTPLINKNPTESDHILKIEKSGYNSKTIRIRTPKGYRLTIVSALSVTSDDTAEESQPAPQTTPTTAPSPTAAQSKVLILDTPTGFLRVRSESNINSAQITTVNPGETFPMVSEQTGWYEIKLKDNTTGWISSDYAQKQ